MKSGYEISGEVGDKVKKVATGTIDGVKVVVKEPFSKNEKE